MAKGKVTALPQPTTAPKVKVVVTAAATSQANKPARPADPPKTGRGKH